jgi:hypothetical protein
MNLSWRTGANAETAAGLIAAQNLLELDMSDELYLSQLQVFVTNNGTADPSMNGNLEDFGFYIECDKYDSLAKILNLKNSSYTSDESTYLGGLYLFFGYPNSTIEPDKDSYFDLFMNGSLTIEEANMFRVSWTNGISPSTKIKLKNVYTWNGSSYVQRTILNSNGGNSNFKGETRGIVELKIVLVAGPSPEPELFMSNIRVNAHCNKET